MNLVTGSDTYTDLRTRGLGTGALHQRSQRVPTGELHAIPAGERVAVCGYQPRHVFAGQPWTPGVGIGVTHCAGCVDQQGSG